MDSPSAFSGPPVRVPSMARWMWRRFVLAAGIVVLCTAGTVLTVAAVELKRFQDALGLSPQLQLGSDITPATAGAPQTLLLIGSDKRGKGAGLDALSPPHSDTMLLLRLDPNRPTAMMSVPRDLRVTILPPGRRPTVQKINAAYSIGGAKLATETVTRVLHIPINHVVDTTFGGFRHAVDAIGCVYVDVDRHYFNDVGGAGGYATINIQPGYQRLCGSDALDYVRFRHTDTDLVRNARQQDFLREARDQIGIQGLLGERDRLERIFGQYTETDIHSASDILHLFDLVAISAGRPIRQVHFRATVGLSYVTATRAQMSENVGELLRGPGTTPATPAPAPSPAHRRGSGGASSTSLVAATPDELASARSAAAQLPFPLLYPTRRDGSSSTADLLRVYSLPDHDNHVHAAYRVVVSKGDIGQYYGVEGTDWMHPPILSEPAETRTIAGRTYRLYWEGQRLRLVAWQGPRAVYWLENTLEHDLSPRQMLAIARATAPVS